MSDTSRVVVSYSSGAASAVALKIAATAWGASRELHAIKCDLRKDEHPDSLRFDRDVELWTGQKIEYIRNPKYDGIDDVFIQVRFIVGPFGAACTKRLKQEVADAYCLPTDLRVLGYPACEQDRIDAMEERHPDWQFAWVLRDGGITKTDCYRIVVNAGIELPWMYRNGYDHNNCFSGTTTFVSDRGTRTLASASGSTARILSSEGWRDALISQFGEQEIFRLTVERNGVREVIETTGGHEWIVPRYVNRSQGTVVSRTDQLKPGKVLPAGYLAPSRSYFNREGVRHGFTFGDGAIYNAKHSLKSKAFFASCKMEVAQYFDKLPTASGMVHGLPAYFKSIPSLQETTNDYRLGFLIGLIASDGCVVAGGVSISNKSPEAIESIAEIARSVGWFVASVKHRRRTTNYKSDAELSTVTISGACIHPDWLIRSDHRSRASAKRTSPKGFRVISVEATGRVEPVFCATVPHVHNFTLGCGVLTRNCIGCVKGGRGYWNKIRRDFPEVFARRAAVQREIGAGFGGGASQFFLDELGPDEGRDVKEPDIECGIFCSSYGGLVAAAAEKAKEVFAPSDGASGPAGPTPSRLNGPGVTAAPGPSPRMDKGETP